MNDLDDATIAAVDCLMDIIRSFPADEGRAKWELWDFLVRYQCVVAVIVRRRMQEPSEN
jgi:hypothetical protein